MTVRMQAQGALAPEWVNVETRLRLVDVAGRFYVAEYSWTEEGIELRRGHLPTGMYFYKIVSSDPILARGKIVVE